MKETNIKVLEAAHEAMKSAGEPESQIKACQDYRIVENKVFRDEFSDLLACLQGSPIKSRQRSIAITELENVICRLGLDLKDAGAPNPYPNSKDPSNTIVDPTAPEVAKGFAPEESRGPHYGAGPS